MTTLTCPLWSWDDRHPSEVLILTSFTGLGRFLEFLTSGDQTSRGIADYDHFMDDQGLRKRLVIPEYEVVQVNMFDQEPQPDAVQALAEAKDATGFSRRRTARKGTGGSGGAMGSRRIEMSPARAPQPGLSAGFSPPATSARLA